VVYPWAVSRLLLAAALAVAAALPLSACQRPTDEQCIHICWRYNELGFWEQFEAEAATLSPDARASLRAEREKTWAEMKARKVDPGFDNCVRECRRAARPEDVACVDAAKTAAAAQRCLVD